MWWLDMVVCEYSILQVGDRMQLGRESFVIGEVFDRNGGGSGEDIGVVFVILHFFMVNFINYCIGYLGYLRVQGFKMNKKLLILILPKKRF